jgi:ribosome-associated toxin RatA of RatAB toxin-antitoxin module
MRRLALYPLAMFILLSHALTWAQGRPPTDTSSDTLTVSAEHVNKGGESFYELQATGVVHAAPQLVWKKLTDYDEMQAYVPNLASAKLISHSGQESTIKQKWVKRIFFFTQTVNLVVKADEHPISRIDISLVSGDMKKYSAVWEMAPTADGGTRISYHGEIEPDSYIPSFFGTSMMQSDLTNMMHAVLKELDK